MAGFSSYDDIINEITTNGKVASFDMFKIGATGVANAWYDLARCTGFPAAIADGAVGSGTPGAGGTVCTNLGYNLANQTPDKKFLLTMSGCGGNISAIMIYDRLAHVSGITLSSTGTKNVGTPALTRYTDGYGVQAWIEFTTASTATIGAYSMNSYTDQGSNTGQAGGNISQRTGVMQINSMVGPMPMAAGDLGLKSVETINVATATATGVGQLVLIRPLAILDLPVALQYYSKDLVLQNSIIPRIYDGASIGVMTLMTSTTAVNWHVNMKIGWG